MSHGAEIIDIAVEPGVARKIRPRIWEPTYLLNREMIRTISQEVATLFPIGWEGRILDVGCGSQPYRHLFEGRCREYVGCDLHPRDPAIVNCPADDLAFGDAEFDAVVCFQVLEHVPEPWNVLKECSRVLKPGGKLLLTAPFMFPHHPSPTDFYRYTHEGLRHLAQRVGIEVDQVIAQCRSVPTLCVILNFYLWAVRGMFNSKLPLKPLGWIVHGLLIIPINIVGLLASLLPAHHKFEKGNTGFANYMLVGRKA